MSTDAIESEAPKKTRRPQQRAEDTRERILGAAIHQFASGGFDGVTTRAVAEAAGVRHALVTYHFQGKDGLWRAALDRTVRSFVERQRVRCEGLRGVDDAQKLRILLEEFIRYSADNTDLHRLMTYAAKGVSPQLEEMVSGYLHDYFIMIADLILKAQKAGAFVPGDPNHLHYLFIGATTRIFMQSSEVERIIGCSPLSEAFVDQHVQQCLALFFRHPGEIVAAKGTGRAGKTKRP
ncbi:TetR/AcrR family transcriptional regulator [Rhizorhabdus dicambivorans]|uniref:TetR/AcrR family transcriptional regulator n=1 Tax=Rhizorhabdus dicambivorans TaxID=1850238 RepID=A0A2A4FXU0_9SPHN|nr:TetR/AcrR family transcriptional regulator [Rhizorhabdus dicambivorans]ATE64162.1 TetR/AcrR family transcriptional regulator [Rhizorhabdus dicambivorans]PCE42566.1 TetR/AcrR family transcriptional regulator [Rhizorhabdus dicambivorans]